MTITLDLAPESLDRLAWFGKQTYNNPEDLASAIEQLAQDIVTGVPPQEYTGLYKAAQPARVALPATRTLEWEIMADKIDEMCESDEFGWADDTLAGIRDSIVDKRSVTVNQRQAVTNIAKSKGWEMV